MTTDIRTFTFDDPRFHMTVLGRVFVRIARRAAGLLVIAATATLLVSDAPEFFWLGVFLSLMLVDSLFHSGEGKRTLAALQRSGTVNVAPAFDRNAFHMLEDAFDRSVILGRDAHLQIAIQFAHATEGEELLRELDISPEEFRQKAEEIRDSETGRATRRDRDADLHIVTVRAADVALENSSRFVEPGHLFAAVLRAEHPLVARLAEAFALRGGEIERALGFARPIEQNSADVSQRVVRAYRVLATPAVVTDVAMVGAGLITPPPREGPSEAQHAS